ncbi:MAG: hypothetical protein SPI25_05135 [Dialister sp.]|nr:hypothetical protein [Dialister sp.]
MRLDVLRKHTQAEAMKIRRELVGTIAKIKAVALEEKVVDGKTLAEWEERYKTEI